MGRFLVEITNDSSLQTVNAQSFSSVFDANFGDRHISFLVSQHTGTRRGLLPKFCSKSGVHVLLDGEIVNDQELQEELGESGLSEADVIVALYLKYGMNFLRRIEGEFAIAIFDENKQKLYLSKDVIGVKPIYFSVSESRILFASQVFDLVNLLDDKSINLNYFASRMLLDPFVGYNDSTAFSNITALKPSTFVELDEKFSIREHLYYDTEDSDENDLKCWKDEDIRNTFETSVKNCLKGDEKIGCALSGGFDSSLISVTASKQMKRLTLFSVIIEEMRNSSKDDLSFAKIVYNSIKNKGVEHKYIKINSPVTLSLIDDLVKELGAPIYDQRVFVWYDLYKGVSADGIEVLLNGQGADELWYGYYPKIGIWSWFSYLYHENLNKETVREYFVKSCQRSVLCNKINAGVLAYFEKLVDGVYDELMKFAGSSLEKLTKYMFRTVLPSLASLEEVISTMNRVVMRSPFLDTKLIDIALSTPPSRHLGKKKMGKDLLKEIFEKDLPSDVINRVKSPMPKSHEDTEWIENLFKENQEAIFNSRLVNKVYNVDELRSILSSKSSSFYGGLGEALLQVISTWRFGEVFGV